MKFNILFPSILFLLIFLGCNSSETTLIPYNGTILTFGDSLTIGKGVDIADSYPSILAKLSGRNVINAGITGEETAEGLLRLPIILEEVKPDLLILLEGGNDILRDRNQNLIKNNLSEMIKLTINKDIPIILIGVPDKNMTTDSAGFYRELAEEYNLLLEKKIIKSLLINPVCKYDDHHFNKKGYNLLAETIYKLLQDNGIL